MRHQIYIAFLLAITATGVASSGTGQVPDRDEFNAQRALFNYDHAIPITP